MKRCTYYDVCENKRPSSITCSSGGGNYCGKFRDFKEKEDKMKKMKKIKKRGLIIENEI
jgi:hypothetical protein